MCLDFFPLIHFSDEYSIEFMQYGFDDVVEVQSGDVRSQRVFRRSRDLGHATLAWQ